MPIRIPKETLISMVEPDLKRLDLNINMATSRFHKHFCSRMAQIGHCSQVCQDCQPYIRHVFGYVVQSRDPYAHLVWAIREVVEGVVDQEPEIKPGDHSSQNPYDQFIGTLL